MKHFSLRKQPNPLTRRKFNKVMKEINEQLEKNNYVDTDSNKEKHYTFKDLEDEIGSNYNLFSVSVSAKCDLIMCDLIVNNYLKDYDKSFYLREWCSDRMTIKEIFEGILENQNLTNFS